MQNPKKLKASFNEAEKLILNWAVDHQEEAILSASAESKAHMEKVLREAAEEFDEIPAKVSDYVLELAEQLENLELYRQDITEHDNLSESNLTQLIMAMSLHEGLGIDDWLVPHIKPLMRKLKLVYRYKVLRDEYTGNFTW